ncbi:MAG: MarR family transcriptional regulator [Clostridiales bacterium]|nr:MarR family transcriptional regulator [Clostridiales bacterium]
MPDERNIWIRMKAILRSARQIVNTELEPLDLTGAEGDILFHLLSESDEISQETLADRLDIGKAAISRTVGSLENKGYIHRRRLPEDSRAYRIKLTPKARKISEQIDQAYKNVYEIALTGIDKSEFARLDLFLGVVHQNLDEWESKKCPNPE